MLGSEKMGVSFEINDLRMGDVALAPLDQVAGLLCGSHSVMRLLQSKLVVTAQIKA